MTTRAVSKAVVVALVSAACARPGASSRAALAGRAPTAADAGAERSRLGLPCESAEPFARGDCGPGERCFGGGRGRRCVAFCPSRGACPGGGVCAETPQLGELCLTPCERDDQCLAPKVCDPAWRGCAAPRSLTPRRSACSAAALSRRSFGPPVQVSPARPDLAYDWEPTAALLPSGALAVAYTGRARADLFAVSSLYVASIAPDATPSTPRVLPTNRAEHYDAWMTSDDAGTAHLVWLGHQGRGADVDSAIEYATSVDGTTWSSPRVIDLASDCPSGPDGCFDKPMIAARPTVPRGGSPLTVLCYSSERGVRCRRSGDRGASFGASVEVPGADVFGDLRVDDAGGVHFVSNAGASSHAEWFGAPTIGPAYQRSDDGAGSFRASTRVSPSGASSPVWFSNSQVAHDATRGVTYVAYVDGGPSMAWDLYLAASRDGGATWSRVKVNDDATCAVHMTPSLALDPGTGATHLLWTENRGGVGRVAYTRCDPGGARCAANEAVSDPMADFALTRHSPQWLGEYNALVLDPGRHRLHAVYTAIVREGGSAVARIFYARAAL